MSVYLSLFVYCRFPSEFDKKLNWTGTIQAIVKCSVKALTAQVGYLQNPVKKTTLKKLALTILRTVNHMNSKILRDFPFKHCGCQSRKTSWLFNQQSLYYRVSVSKVSLGLRIYSIAKSVCPLSKRLHRLKALALGKPHFKFLNDCFWVCKHTKVLFS